MACECSTVEYSGVDLACTYPDCAFGRWEARRALAERQDAVLCTHADPDLVVHRVHKDCAQEAPHQWAVCGVVRQPQQKGAG